jgi:perosamine synthetase
VGAKHAVAVCNATAALHLALRVADIGPGHRVITSPNTFLASANCAAFVGARPDFADIEPATYNLDPVALEAAWAPDTRAVVAVDYAGQAADLPAIAAVAKKHGALVIEDACHGIGGGFVHEHNTWKLGGHPWADLTAFSFHPVKTLTTGEGGMLVTDNPEFAARARRLRHHGMERDPSRFTPAELCPPTAERGPWFHEMQDLGYNYRITDFQCALGRSQLRKLDRFIARRREIVSRYNDAFAGLSWLTRPRLRQAADRDQISWHLYTVQLDFTQLGRTRTEVMRALQAQGVGTQVLYIPVYLQPWYRATYGYQPGKCPVAEAFYQRALSLPLYPAMTDANIDHVIRVVLQLGP